MKKLLTLAFVAFCLVAMSSCKDEKINYHDLILGSWTSTGESAETTLAAGTQQLPEGIIACSFDNRYVEIIDMHMNCLGEKAEYTLFEEDGTLWLKVETATTNVPWHSFSRVSKLTEDSLVLENNDFIGGSFRYVFKRPSEDRSSRFWAASERGPARR